MAGGVFGDGQGLEGVAGEGLEDRVAVGGHVGAGAAQGDEEFVDGGGGLDLEEGVAAAGGAGDAADGGAGVGGVGEGDDGAVGFYVAEFGVGGGGRAGEVDEAFVPAGVGVGPVVVGDAGGDPEEGGGGDGGAAAVGGLVPAASGGDDDGDVVVEGAGADGGQGAVLEADAEADEAEAVVGRAGVKYRIQVWYIRLCPFLGGCGAGGARVASKQG